MMMDGGYRHPHMEKIYELAQLVTNRAGTRKNLMVGLDGYFRIYAEIGDDGPLTVERVGQEIFNWLRFYRYAVLNRSAGVVRVRIWELLHVEHRMEAPSKIFRNQMTSLEDMKTHERVLQLRNALHDLKPRTFVPVQGEPEWVTIWWLYFWTWKQWLMGWPGRKLPMAFRTFAKLTRELQARDGLLPEQSEALDLLDHYMNAKELADNLIAI